VERLDVLQGRNVAAQHGGKVLARCIQEFQRMGTEQIVHRPDHVHDHGILTNPTLAGFATNTEISPGVIVSTDEETVVPALDYGPSLGRDLFNEITNEMVSTASWLEDSDMLSMLELGFAGSDSVLDSLY
jgi:hypothetical protein